MSVAAPDLLVRSVRRWQRIASPAARWLQFEAEGAVQCAMGVQQYLPGEHDERQEEKDVSADGVASAREQHRVQTSAATPGCANVAPLMQGVQLGQVVGLPQDADSVAPSGTVTVDS